MTETTPADEPLQGEVLDADTLQLITQLGASLSKRAVELADENRALRAEAVELRAEITTLELARGRPHRSRPTPRRTHRGGLRSHVQRGEQPGVVGGCDRGRT